MVQKQFISFLKTNFNKAPLEKQDKWNYKYNDIQYTPNIGMIIPEGYIVLDVDNQPGNTYRSDAFSKVLKYMQINTIKMKTDKGVHYYFKSDLKLINSNFSTPIGIPVDIRTGNKKNNFVVIKRNGFNRIWNDKILNDFGPDMLITKLKDIPELPWFLKPINKKLKESTNLADGEGRNEYLVKSLITPLKQEGYNEKQIREAFDIINNVIFLEPLPLIEIERMFDKFKEYSQTIEVKPSIINNQINEEEGKRYRKNIIAAETFYKENNLRTNKFIHIRNPETGGFEAATDDDDIRNVFYSLIKTEEKMIEKIDKLCVIMLPLQNKNQPIMDLILLI